MKSGVHKVLIGIGAIGCWVAYFCELSALQPYSTIGLIVAPIFTIVGIVFWSKFYKQKRGHSPMFSTVWGNVYAVGSTYSLRTEFVLRHFPEFLTAGTLLWMVIVWGFSLGFRSSDAFIATKDYCEHDTAILKQTGAVKGYGPIMSGSFSLRSDSSVSNIWFTIVGQNGNFKANSRLVGHDGNWVVKLLTIE